MPLKDATCVLVLDDFFDSIKDYAKTTLSKAKDFVADNKDVIHNFLGALITATIP